MGTELLKIYQNYIELVISDTWKPYAWKGYK